MWTNPFEYIRNDAPQYKDPDQDGDQNIMHVSTEVRPSIDPDQDGDQDVLHVPTEVRPSDHTDQSDRAVYRLDPCTFGMEPRPNPRPDD